MDDWQTLDHEAVPGDKDSVLYLMTRNGEYTIHVSGRELMSDSQHGSEDALSDEACDRLDRLHDARILVGGLGMGFTMAAALRRVGSEGQITVAELIPAVVRWNRETTGTAAGFPLNDTRSQVYIGDVVDLVDDPPEPWSAILLDVDNGPRALTRPYNRWLYHRAGLQRAMAALIPGGILGVWSAHNDPSFTKRLTEAGFETEVIIHHEPGRPTPDDSGDHVLWMARRPVA